MEENYIKSIDHIVHIFFQMTLPDQIISGEIKFDDYPKELFSELCRNEIKYLSDTEINLLYDYMKSFNSRHKVNVFDVLKRVATDFLHVRENKPVCRYEQLLRWRKLVRSLGEDLPICAFLAERTERTGYKWTDFEWNTVIPHDNMQLNRIMQRGISDNHFHLFGSTPSFHLIWIKMMNQPADGSIISYLHKLDKSKRIQSLAYTGSRHEDSLALLQYKAAVIRHFLYTLLFEDGVVLEEDIANIYSALSENVLNVFKLNGLKVKIDGIRVKAACNSIEKQFDYALCHMDGRSANHDFEGERALLYNILYKYYVAHDIDPECMEFLYIYLVIKCKLYREFIQVNDTIGFENFQIYNGRKNDVLYTNADKQKMVEHAVLETLKTGNILSLEMRIVPARSVQDNVKMIKMYDKFIKKDMYDKFAEKDCSSQNENYKNYYVFHFPKKADEPLIDNGIGWVNTCRHWKYRRNLNRLCKILENFRTNAPKEAARVLGIDACSQEIGCRPEVFGPVFRTLSGHVCNDNDVKQWKITYHVGEDFLDLTDGLRAIDEAILFLNMKRGDRLGHATALGIDVQKWYSRKKNTIIINKHDFLDNVVWLYNKLIEYDVHDCEALKGYLLGKYNEYFYYIYGQVINKDYVKDIYKEIVKKKNSSDFVYKPLSSDYNTFDIYTYYDAWKLRGDNPTLYLRNYYVTSKDVIIHKCNINYNLKDGDLIRENAKAVVLFLYYHYSVGVRNRGAEIDTITLSDYYAEGVKKVQKAMQYKISDKGLCIEANPSSNYLISNINTYKEHPIRSLYNYGLCIPGQQEDCPQMNISVNTDDKGIFYTSLENEFALMACAMEYDEENAGNRLYPPHNVYEWIDNIRKMGNDQSFLERI